MVAASFHVSSMDQIGAAAGDDMAAAYVHGNAHHAMRWYPATCGGDHGGDVRSAGLRVKVRSPAALTAQLSLWVVVGRATSEESRWLAFRTPSNEKNCTPQNLSNENTVAG